MNKKKFVFTFDNIDLSDEDSVSEIDSQDHQCRNDKERRNPLPSSIKQPPFFRTRNFDDPLFPSRCYAVPEVSAMEDTDVKIIYNKDTKKYTIPKNNHKTIRFIGIDAVSYDKQNPSTQLSPLSKEECDSIFNKTEREAFTIVEDEETLRNDSLLDNIDKMDEDDDSIPPSRLRQYIHSVLNTKYLNVNDNSTTPSESDITDSDISLECSNEIITERKSISPQIFTFDTVELNESDDAPFSVQPSVEPIATTRDSLCNDEPMRPSRLSLVDLETIASIRSETFNVQQLRSPRLSLSHSSNQSSLHTPRCITGPMGAARIKNNEVSFFHSPDLQKESVVSDNQTINKDATTPVIKRLSLADRIDAIRSFNKTHSASLSSFQKQLQRILDRESLVLQLYSIIDQSFAITADIDNLQYDIKNEMTKNSQLEGECSIIENGLPQTMVSIRNATVTTIKTIRNKLDCYGWVVQRLEADDIQLSLPCLNFCSFTFRIWTINYISMYSSLQINSNSSEIFEQLVTESKLCSHIRKEIRYHELYDYYHTIWFLCMYISRRYAQCIGQPDSL